jgi:hypothetical protein
MFTGLDANIVAAPAVARNLFWRAGLPTPGC